MVREDEIPCDMRSESEDRRQELIEHVSNVDEILGDMFLGKYRAFFYFVRIVFCIGMKYSISLM